MTDSDSVKGIGRDVAALATTGRMNIDDPSTIGDTYWRRLAYEIATVRAWRAAGTAPAHASDPYWVAVAENC